jgi:acyl-CoA thioesterase II
MTAPSSLRGLLEVFDVETVGEHRYRGQHDAGDRAVIDGSQVLAQSIVAATRSCDGKVVRSAHAIFVSPVGAGEPIELEVDVVREGRTVATVRVLGSQGGRPKVDALLLLDVPQPDLVRRSASRPDTAGPDAAIALDMPVEGREIRLVGVADPNEPDHVGPPVLDAWLRYDDPPARDDLARALLAHFTGHLSISTSMFPHPGLGTAQAHHSVSTGVMTIGVAFHEPVRADGWLLYRHESTQVGAGMSFVRGQVFGDDGALVASFTQEGLLRAFVPEAGAEQIPTAARL